jgi:restriction system protein
MRKRKQTLQSTLRGLPWGISASIGIIGATIIYAVARTIDRLTQESGIVLWLLHNAHAGYILQAFAVVFFCVCSLAACQTAAADSRRAGLLDGQRDLASIKRLSWQDFELLVSEAYRRLGFAVEEVGQGGADGGVDLLLTRQGRKTLVQCKRWKARIGAPVVREQFGLMHHHNAHDVKIVCASGFTKEAINFAADKAIELVDGEGLLALVNSLQRGRRDGNVMTCFCGAKMTERGQGENRFFGCTRFPVCKVTRPVS